MLVFDIFYKIIKIDESMILFLNCNTVVDNTLKVIILLGKFHIQYIKQKLHLLVPHLSFFCKELNIFYDSLTSITINKKCIKTSLILKNVICKM